MHGHRPPSLGWILWLPFLLLALPGAIWGDPPAPLPETTIGVPVTAIVPHASEMFDEPRRPTPERRSQDGERRAIPFRRTPGPMARAALAPGSTANNVTQTAVTADYPGLGVDASNIYITANMYDASDVGQYSKVWVIPKNDNVLTGNSTITWYEFPGPPGSGFSMQPAHSFGTAAAEYFLFEGNSSSLRLARIDNVTGTPVWHAPASVPVTPYTPSNSLAGAPQLGDPGLIDTADTRMLNTVYRNGSVWGTHHVGGAGGKTEVAWYRIDPLADAIVAQGRVSDPGRWYYYPSVAVNQDNVAAIGFSGSSGAEYAGAYYTVVWPSTGLADSVTLLKAGEAPYNKTLSGPSIRWGDFSATSVDPVDGTTFWTLQEYAMPQVPFHSDLVSMWGTWWGKIVPGQPLSPPPSLPNPLSSTVAASFAGLENLPLAGNRDVIPPDTMGAAGPSHLVSLLNSEFGVFDKAGNLLSKVPLQSFWASLGTDPGQPADYPFDTKVLYDQYSGRFVAVTLDCTVAPHSWVLVAVSSSSDPTGTWNKWAIAAAPPPPSTGGGGGGGGGCAIAGRSSVESAGDASFGSFLYLLLPAALYGHRRIVRLRHGV